MNILELDKKVVSFSTGSSQIYVVKKLAVLCDKNQIASIVLYR